MEIFFAIPQRSRVLCKRKKYLRFMKISHPLRALCTLFFEFKLELIKKLDGCLHFSTKVSDVKLPFVSLKE